jgi:hypothetical protein
MVNYWIFASNSISNSVKRGVVGIWYFARQTVERYDIDIKTGDRAIIYQPAEIRKEPQKAGFHYVGSFIVDSEPFIESRKEEYYAIKIRDFKLWNIFVPKSEEEKLDTDIPSGSELGRLIHTQMLIPIDRNDYEIIARLYGEKIEQKFKNHLNIDSS